MIKGLTPRLATEDDLDQIVKIESYSNNPPWSKSAFASELGKKTSRFWVVTDDETDEVVHAYVVFSMPAEQAHIQTIGVKKESRRQGVAAYFIRQIINFVLRNKGDSIVLEVRRSNNAALALYQHLGFIVLHTAKKHYPDGEDAYSMIYRFDAERVAKLQEESDDDFNSDLPTGNGHGSNKNFN